MISDLELARAELRSETSWANHYHQLWTELECAIEDFIADKTTTSDLLKTLRDAQAKDIKGDK